MNGSFGAVKSPVFLREHRALCCLVIDKVDAMIVGLWLDKSGRAVSGVLNETVQERPVQSNISCMSRFRPLS